MEEGMSDKKITGIKNYEEKEAECLDDTSPEEIEGYLSDKNDDNNENIDEGK